MNTYEHEVDTRALLEELAAAQKKNLLLSRITAVMVALLTVAVALGLGLLLPRLNQSMQEARAALTDTRAVMARVNTALDTVDSVTSQLGGVDEEKLSRLVEAIGQLDPDAVSQAVKDFGAAMESLANARGVLDKLGETLGNLDLERLTESLQTIGSALQGLNGFHLFG